MSEEIGLAVGTENYWLTKMDIKIAKLVFGWEGACEGGVMAGACQECRAVLASGNYGFHPHPFVPVRFSESTEDAFMAVGDLRDRYQICLFSLADTWVCNLASLGKPLFDIRGEHQSMPMAICLAICDALEGERG